MFSFTVQKYRRCSFLQQGLHGKKGIPLKKLWYITVLLFVHAICQELPYILTININQKLEHILVCLLRNIPQSELKPCKQLDRKLKGHDLKFQIEIF